MSIFKNRKTAEEVGGTALPRHIAIIMDGNGRWAKARGLPRAAGHAAGAETFRRIATYCRDIGISYLTVYAFSTENWKRPKDEIDAIMGLLAKYLREAVDEMEQDHIRLKVLGDPAILPQEMQALIRETAEISERYEGFQANVCINYGGRDEIVRAAMRYAEEYRAGKAPVLTEEIFSGYMYSAGIPDPDIVIRPGGELRLSNFLMWESAYSELVFTDMLWPDFGPKDIDAAIAEYRRRDRRFGAVKVENKA
jgi:undecaprenyl diphosphate synthase